MTTPPATSRGVPSRERDARDATFSNDARDASTVPATETENTHRTRSRSESSSKTAKAESSLDARSSPNPNGSGAEDSDSDSDSFELLSVADFSEMEHVGTCHFAVSWLLTWFAHSLDSLEDVSRLFDAFLGSDPLMPLYVGAAAIVADRDALLSLARGETPSAEEEMSDGEGEGGPEEAVEGGGEGRPSGVVEPAPRSVGDADASASADAREESDPSGFQTEEEQQRGGADDAEAGRQVRERERHHRQRAQRDLRAGGLRRVEIVRDPPRL